MGLIADIYRCGRLSEALAPRSMIFEDCTMNGWSVNYDNVTVVTDKGAFRPNRSRPGVIIRRHPTMNRLHVVSQEHANSGKMTMFGGNFLFCSDTRFGELCRELLNGSDQFIGAIPIHDRVE